MNKIERLTELIQLINDNSERESAFSRLFEKLMEEYNSNDSSADYKNDLRQTKEKQAKEYIEAKSSGKKKGLFALYKSFTSNFEDDVRYELRRLQE